MGSSLPGWQFSRGQFSWEQFLGHIFPGGIFPRIILKISLVFVKLALFFYIELQHCVAYVIIHFFIRYRNNEVSMFIFKFEKKQSGSRYLQNMYRDTGNFELFQVCFLV